MAQTRYLWEIMVPTNWNDGKPVRTRHHRNWDNFVRKIAGGMTLFKPATGYWVDPESKNLFKDRMIPVRIACTENQIRQIATFTNNHYRQEAVFVYVVSDKVLIIKANGKERQDQITDKFYKPQSGHEGVLPQEDIQYGLNG